LAPKHGTRSKRVGERRLSWTTALVLIAAISLGLWWLLWMAVNALISALF
jgi:hypothetical protein